MRMMALAMLLLACGCQPRGPKAEAPPVSGDPFHYEIVEGDEPNEYSVRLAWNNQVKPVTWFVHRRAERQELLELAKLSGDQLTMTDTEVEPGKQYEYVLGYTEQGDFHVHGTLQLQVPTDFVATGRLRHDEFPPAHRVFFRGTIETSPWFSELKIVANEIISEDAVIEVTGFSRGSSTEKLIIAAPRARGHLKIIAKGMPGRSGFRKGPSFPEEMLPLNGADSPLIQVETYSNEGFSVDVQREPGKGGKWFEEPRTPGALDGDLRPFCVRQNQEEFGNCEAFPKVLKTK